MVSLLCLSLICLEPFAAVSATRPLIQRTPRRYSPIKRKLDTRIAGLLVFGRQSGPCCSNGGLFNFFIAIESGIIILTVLFFK